MPNRNLKKNTLSLAFVLLSLFFISVSNCDAEPLSPQALFVRCYSLFTNRKVPSNHPLLAAVKQKTMDPIDACMKVLSAGDLVATGTREGQLVSDTPEGRLVLNTMNSFHRSWFPSDNFAAALPEGVEFYGKNKQIFDEAEAALHLSRVLFTGGVPFSDIVTSKSAIEALRTSGPLKETTPTTERLLQARVPGGPTSDLVPWNPPLVQTGELLGLRKISLNPEKQNLTANSSVGFKIGTLAYKYDQAIPVHASTGGGILGTKSYALLNIGYQTNEPADGGLRMPRRWAQSVYHDLLCRSLPVIRLSDAAPYVERAPTATTPPFRSSNTCMQCHAAMDPMSATIRNFSLAPIPTGLAKTSTLQINNWPVTLPRETGQVDRDVDFFKRPANGKLFFRSYNGDLIHRDVLGTSELGQALAETNDLYVCAASRYFNYFTGVEVNLQDAQDTSLVPLTQSEIYYRDLVIRLGLEFKSTKDTKLLIKKILESPPFRARELR